MEWLEGGVTVPAGFRASGVRCGLKKRGLDLALVECPEKANCAAVFTKNLVKAAPVIVSKESLDRSGAMARAVVVNSGNANACNGPKGLADARRVAARCADLLGTTEECVLLASTGVIGRPLPVERILSGLEEAVSMLSSSEESGGRAARAIMTTDTRQKEVAASVCRNGECYRFGGMAKGAGMIHPGLATMISVVTTDARIAPDLLLEATRHAADRSFNMITIDGDMSTNDMLLVMSSGGSGSPEISGDGEPYRVFSESLGLVCSRLAREIVRDAEGARKLFEVLVVGARTRQDAGACARSIAGSNLVKSAVFGCDPNWGRILAAAGYSGAEVDQDRVKIWLEDPAGRTLEWVIDGQQVSEARNEAAREFMSGEEFRIGVDLGLGDSESLSWGCDLTYEYVKINSEYTT